LLADTTAPVPEPGSGLLLLGGVAILASLLHRRRSSGSAR
jgi:hypothetical protein